MDKKVKEEEEKKKKEEEAFNQLLRDVFQKYDVDKSGRLDKEEVRKFIEDVISKFFDYEYTCDD